MLAINRKAILLIFSFILLSGINVVAQDTPQIVDLDFDGDGRTDPVIYRPTVGEWWYLKSSNNGNGAAQFGTATDFPVAADYTGDGIADMAFFRPSTGEWFVLRSEDRSFYSFPFGETGDLAMAGDFDGDGKADPTIYRPTNKTWYTIDSSTGETDIRQFGAGADKPKIADFDGDGKDDIAIYRPSTKSWWINQSQDGVIVYQFGVDAEELHNLIPADYTGDGKADVAFIKKIEMSEGRETLEWYILRSEDQSYYSFVYGRGTDKPAIGDYDGDGKTDVTIFRSGTSTWYIARSTFGLKILTFGSNTDIPIALYTSLY